MFMLLAFSEVLYAKNPVLALTHENYVSEVLESKDPIVILYSPSSKGPAQFSSETDRQMSYTYRAFKRSAQHFSGQVRFAYFDLQSCIQGSWSSEDANKHILHSHILRGYPTIILYKHGQAKTLEEKELTRMETGVPFPWSIPPFVKALDFLVEKDILEQSDPPYVLTAEGKIIQEKTFSAQ